MGKARDMRLMADRQKIEDLERQFAFFSILETHGNPPAGYLLEYRLTGYLNPDGETAPQHRVRVVLPEKYPFSAPPRFTLTQGLFHPNIYKNGDVCIGWYLNNWTPAIRIDDLLTDIAKMIAFTPDSYNLKSPANYDCDAAWIAAHQTPADSTPILGEPLPADAKVESLPKITIAGNKSTSSPLKVTIKREYR